MVDSPLVGESIVIEKRFTRCFTARRHLESIVNAGLHCAIILRTANSTAQSFIELRCLAIDRACAFRRLHVHLHNVQHLCKSYICLQCRGTVISAFKMCLISASMENITWKQVKWRVEQAKNY